MFYPQKKTYRPPYNKSRFCENEKWDANIPHTITFEKKQQSFPEEQQPPAKYKKHKRFDNESADPSNHRPTHEKRAYNYPPKRWGHDKYDESASPHLFFSNRPNNKGLQKKPDRQLYCVREKQNTGTEPKETIEYRKKSHKKEEHLIRPNSAKETAASTRDDDIQSQEEENSFISSLTSLLSQKEKAKEEDAKGINQEFRDNAVIARGPIIDLLHSIHAADPHVLFEVMLQNEKGTQNILIWDNEKNYEKFLDEICQKNNIDGNMELYFKINLLKRIRDLQPNNKEVESLLNGLLDENFRVMLAEPLDCTAAYTRPLNLISG